MLGTVAVEKPSRRSTSEFGSVGRPSATSPGGDGPSDVGLPVTHWSASLLGEHVRSEGIEISDRSVSRILRDADLQPHRQQMYLTSHDDEFREKRDDVLRVYYETPKSEHVVCVDEKTGIQALERRYPDIAMTHGQPVRREFEYIRHGTLCWMGAFDVRRGKPFGFASRGHDGDVFIELLDLIDAVYPPGRGHVVMDNVSTHDTPDESPVVVSMTSTRPRAWPGWTWS